MPGTAATVMPQIGSIAIAGGASALGATVDDVVRGARRGRRACRGARRRSARGSRARSRPACGRRCRYRPARRSARGALRPRRPRAARRARRRRACGLATRPTYGTPASSARRSVCSSSRPWAATTSARSRGDGSGCAGVDRDELEPELRAERPQRAGDRRVADDEHARRGQHRLEEDLDRAAGQARVLHRHGAVLDRDRLAASPGSSPTRLRPGTIRKSNASLGLDRLQRVDAHAVLRAHTADEALDRAVAEDERDVAGLHARRTLRAHDRRGHERRALGGELLGSPRQGGA